MAGPGGGPRLDGPRFRWRELSAVRIEAKNKDAIEPFVGHQDEAPRGIEHHVMRMGTGLLDFVWAGLTRQLHQLMLIFKGSIRGDGHHGDRAAGVVRYDHELAARIYRLSNPIVAAGGCAIEQLSLTCLSVKRKGSGIVAVAMHGIKEALVGAQ